MLATRESHDQIDLSSLVNIPPHSLCCSLAPGGQTEDRARGEREEAGGLLSKLRGQGRSIDQQLLFVYNSRRLATWGFCQHLLARCWECPIDDPQANVAYARLAVAASEQLDVERYGALSINDLRARAWTHLAIGLHGQGDLDAAASAFRAAESLLAEGTTAPIERARYLYLLANLHSRESRSEEAIPLVRTAGTLYHEAGDERGYGVCLALEGLGYGRLGDVSRALRLTERALCLLDPPEDMGWFLAVRHNLILLLEMDGQLNRALVHVDGTVAVCAALGDRRNLFRLRVVQGKLCARLERFCEAEAALLEARHGFLAEGTSVAVAELSLQLALLYQRQGRTAELRHLAADLHPLLMKHDLNHTARSALTAFQHAVECGEAVPERLERLLSSLYVVTHPNAPEQALTSEK